MTETNDFSWMDAPVASPPSVRPPKKKRVKKKARKALKAAKRPTKKPVRVPKPAAIEAKSKMNKAALRGKVMFKAVNGRKRILACDGEYVFFRRKSCIHPDRPSDMTHEAIVRHQRFLDRGDYTYIETQDDVEICKVNPQSPFARKGVYLGQLSEGALSRLVCLAACKRDWTVYADGLDELASLIKGKWDSKMAPVAWNEHLAYMDHQIALRGGPTPQERGPALARVREARGEGKGRLIMLPGK